MVASPLMLTDILVKCSTVLDVHQLHAPTNSEDRQIAIESAAKENLFESASVWDQAPEFLASAFAIKLGWVVKISACDHNTVHQG